MATKLERGGGGKALVAGPQINNFIFLPHSLISGSVKTAQGVSVNHFPLRPYECMYVHPFVITNLFDIFVFYNKTHTENLKYKTAFNHTIFQ